MRSPSRKKGADLRLLRCGAPCCASTANKARPLENLFNLTDCAACRLRYCASCGINNHHAHSIACVCVNNHCAPCARLMQQHTNSCFHFPQHASVHASRHCASCGAPSSVKPLGRAI